MDVNLSTDAFLDNKVYIENIMRAAKSDTKPSFYPSSCVALVRVNLFSDVPKVKKFMSSTPHLFTILTRFQNSNTSKKIKSSCVDHIVFLTSGTSIKKVTPPSLAFTMLGLEKQVQQMKIN